MSYFHRSKNQTEQMQESKRDNKQPIGKQHADNQSEEDKSLRGGRSKKGEKSKINIFFSPLLINIIIKLYYLVETAFENDTQLSTAISYATYLVHYYSVVYRIREKRTDMQFLWQRGMYHSITQIF